MVLILSAIYFPISSIIFMFFTRVPFSKALLINFKWMLFVAFLWLVVALFEAAIDSSFGANLKEQLFNSAKGLSKPE